ncbi:MAG: rubrerythrin family protein, partial [Candidatus Heimdallarchaeota archaeon]|nr:rubrerythrin family protein [Candidatus Heimdallarchaeota archaeon]MCK4768892.1 rubrerythrin family protein [Candidatus Heimdallarchaeota archaeon]
RNRYTMYSKVAKKEGFEQIADIFLVTADNEREHAKWNFQMMKQVRKKIKLDDDEITVEAAAPLVLDNTIANLKAAIAGEHYENTIMYPEFADIAEKEGFPKVANRLRAIGVAEEHHEERYKKLLEQVEGKTVFKKDEKVRWVCRKCGYVHEGDEPPHTCPCCSHPHNYFELLCETY